MRCLEYERMENLGLRGRVLDFGGGTKVNYSDKLPLWKAEQQDVVYESANIDQKTQPTFLIEETGRIPVEPGRYDAVIALNTFEHIYDIGSSFVEINRVLKTGGAIIFIVPFLFRVHAHPDDYFRGTPSFWSRFLIDHGFESIEIEALTWGPFSTAMWVSGAVGPFKQARQLLALFADTVYSAIRYPGKSIFHVDQTASVGNSPFGYFVSAKKSWSQAQQLLEYERKS